MNTNNPDYVKHAKAALASKAEMDKWKTIEIIDAIVAVSSLVIAWLASSWIIAIAGIVICGVVGAYATSQKEKARQDTLDHMNRADGMSETLVGATRGRREAENALAGAISQLDSASSKLRRASTYEEKTKAEAEVVSAQAAIESAKLRLQQATTREAAESQRSQQQEQSDVEQTNQSNQEPSHIGFSGEKVLTNDGYKIYLVKKHAIEKNDVLGKFVCSERLFDSIEEALAFADSLENPATEVISIPEVPEIPELIDGMNELRSNPIPDDDNASSNKDHKTIAQKKNKLAPILIVCTVIVIGLGIFYVLGKDDNSSSRSLKVSPSFDCTKAKSTSEKLICSDSQLATEDNELHELYKLAKIKTGNSAEFKSETVAAWKDREKNCFDKACVLEWYASRKTTYQNIINGTQQSSECQHLLGEEAYDKERADFLEKGIKQYCPPGTKPYWK